MTSNEKELHFIAPFRRARWRPLRHGPLVLAVGILFSAPAARADSVTLEAIGGWQNLQPSTTSVGNAIAGREGTGIVGADLLANLGGLGLGVGVDKTVSGSAQPWAGSLMAGFLIDLPLSLRIDALGEIGRRAGVFGDLFHSTGVTFLGLRPGISFLLGPSPVRLGVSGLVRWPTGSGASGSPDYAIVGRIGLDL